MKVKVMTLRFDESGLEFDGRELDAFMQHHDVVSVVDHFYVHEGLPVLVLVLTYRAQSVRDGQGSRRSEVSGRDVFRNQLTADEQVVFDRLRRWRNERARQEGKPVYLLLTNRQLHEIVTRRPTTLSMLGEIEGIGEARLKQWGKEILEVLQGDEVVPAPADTSVTPVNLTAQVEPSA